MVHAPRLIQGRKHIPCNHLIADKAQVSKQLMVMRLAVGQPAFLIMPVAQEGFLALGAHKVLHMPVLAQRGHHSLLDRTTTRAANGNSHLVVTPQTVQLV